jgi:hypothetical protein
MFALLDTFNDHVISRHRTIEAAVKADRRHQRSIKRMHGPASYIPTKIMRLEADGALSPVSDEEAQYVYYCYDWGTR